MIRAEVKGYIKEQVNSECNNLNKLNLRIEAIQKLEEKFNLR